MPRLAELASAARKSIATPGMDSLRSRSMWREFFGRRPLPPNDENERPAPPPVPGGSYGRSAVAGPPYWASFKRLLESMRSMAPGGWSDDRWEQTKQLVSMAYVAITAKCRIVSQSEFQVYKKDPRAAEGKRPVMEREDPKAYELVRLLEKPNPQDTFGTMVWRWMQQQDLTGTALTWMVPNKLGVPMELYPIPTAIAIPQPAVNPDFPDGYYRIQPVYPYGPFSSYPTPASAVGAPIPAQWMMRFLYPHPLLRYDGYSPLTGVRLEMDELNMVNRSRHYSMRKAINPSAVADCKEVEDSNYYDDASIDRLRTEMEYFMGPENAGGIIVPPPGMSIEPWGANPVDMDYPAGWDQLSNFLLSGFGITKPAAGMVEDSSYSTLYATLKQLDVLTLQPWRDYVAACLTRHLASFFGDDLIVEVRGKRIDDHEIKDKKLSMLMQAKAITKNEMRQELDMPTTDEEWGEEIAGYEAPPEQPGMDMMGGMGGAPAPGAEQPGAAPEDTTEQDLAELDALLAEDEDEIEGSRPTPGDLGRGALGPRGTQPKSLSKRFKRLRRKQLMQAAAAPLNGNGNGHAPAPTSYTKSLPSVYDQTMEALHGE